MGNWTARASNRFASTRNANAADLASYGRRVTAKPDLKPDFKWTDEAKALLEKLWCQDGLAASAIAEQLGTTRNAVLGRIHRLGLQRHAGARNGVMAVGQPSKRQTNPRPPQARRIAIKGHGEIITAKYADEIIDLAPDTSSNPLPLLELKDEHCRYPISGDGLVMMFCADQATIGSYCGRHHRITHQPTRERTDPYWIDTNRVKNRGRRAA